MKVYYLGVFDISKTPADELCAEVDLSEFSRFTRGQYQSFMTMFSKTIAERTQPGRRQSVEEQDYMFHCYARSEGIAGILISKDYPSLTAHAVLSKVVDEFIAQFPTPSSRKAPVSFPALKGHLTTAQDPAQASSIVAIQKELDETKIVLHQTIEQVLRRGEKLDDLVSKSEDLSAQSKQFYKTAKKQNSCCIVM